MTKKREIEFEGRWYKVRSQKTAIPALSEMPRIEALLWLNANTYARGYSRSSNPLAGYAGTLQVA